MRGCLSKGVSGCLSMWMSNWVSGLEKDWVNGWFKLWLNKWMDEWVKEWFIGLEIEWMFSAVDSPRTIGLMTIELCNIYVILHWFRDAINLYSPGLIIIIMMILRLQLPLLLL